MDEKKPAQGSAYPIPDAGFYAIQQSDNQGLALPSAVELCCFTSEVVSVEVEVALEVSFEVVFEVSVEVLVEVVLEVSFEVLVSVEVVLEVSVELLVEVLEEVLVEEDGLEAELAELKLLDTC